MIQVTNKPKNKSYSESWKKLPLNSGGSKTTVKLAVVFFATGKCGSSRFIHYPVKRPAGRAKTHAQNFVKYDEQNGSDVIREFASAGNLVGK